MKKTFYEILWSLADKEGLVDKWKEDGILAENKLTYSWTPKALEKLGLSGSIGNLVLKQDSDSLPNSESFNLSPVSAKKETKSKAGEEATLDWIDDYMFKFSQTKIGIPGKAGDKKGVTKKMIKFLKEYDYTQQEILAATDLYIRNLMESKNIRFIQECGYFISKTTEGVQKSNLATWCEEVRKGGGKRYTSHNVL